MASDSALASAMPSTSFNALLRSRSLERFVDAFTQRRKNLPNLPRRRAVGRHDHYDISNRSRQHTAFRHRFTNANARALNQLERLPGPPVAHEFDSHHHTDLPNIANLRQIPKRLRILTHGRFESAPSVLFFQQFEIRQRRRSSNLISSETVPVKKRFELAVIAQKRVKNFLCRQRRGHRQITGGQSFRERNEIRLNCLAV